MKTSSCKAKGRKLQKEVIDIIREFYGFNFDDVKSIPMGCSGEDIWLSTEARKRFPFSVECKNQEHINIWDSISQAESNAKEHAPLLVFRRNRSKIYAVIEFTKLIELLITQEVKQ